jgi:hypothetical protein
VSDVYDEADAICEAASSIDAFLTDLEASGVTPSAAELAALDAAMASYSRRLRAFRAGLTGVTSGRDTSYHEAGHAVCARLLNFRVDGIEAGRHSGHVDAATPEDDRIGRCSLQLAGLVACRLLGLPWPENGSRGDLDRARAIAAELVPSDPDLAMREVDEFTESILRPYLGAIKRLAATLRQRGRIIGTAAVAAAIDDAMHPVAPAVRSLARRLRLDPVALGRFVDAERQRFDPAGLARWQAAQRQRYDPAGIARLRSAQRSRSIHPRTEIRDTFSQEVK